MSQQPFRIEEVRLRGEITRVQAGDMPQFYDMCRFSSLFFEREESLQRATQFLQSSARMKQECERLISQHLEDDFATSNDNSRHEYAALCKSLSCPDMRVGLPTDTQEMSSQILQDMSAEDGINSRQDCSTLFQALTFAEANVRIAVAIKTASGGDNRFDP